MDTAEQVYISSLALLKVHIFFSNINHKIIEYILNFFNQLFFFFFSKTVNRILTISTPTIHDNMFLLEWMRTTTSVLTDVEAWSGRCANGGDGTDARRIY